MCVDKIKRLEYFKKFEICQKLHLMYLLSSVQIVVKVSINYLWCTYVLYLSANNEFIAINEILAMKFHRNENWPFIAMKMRLEFMLFFCVFAKFWHKYSTIFDLLTKCLNENCLIITLSNNICLNTNCLTIKCLYV